jgi:signal transduction histidine kinase
MSENDAQKAPASSEMTEADLAVLFSATPIATAITDLDTHEVVAVNPAALKLIGRSREEVIGRCSDLFICPTASGKCLITDRNVTETKSERVQLEVDGKHISVVRIVRPVTLRGRACLVECFLRLEHLYVDEELKQTQKKLAEASRLAGLAEVATDVLHNVGNVLNSVNTSTSVVSDHLRQSRIAAIARVAALLREHKADLADFLCNDARGKQLPDYLNQLGEHLATEQGTLLKEMEHIRKHVEHIKDIVAMQQNYAKVAGVSDLVTVTSLVEDAVRMNAGALARHDIAIVREFDEDLPQVICEKHKVLQILVNLISNAKYACDEGNASDKRVTLRVSHDDDRVRVAVMDNGIGIKPEHMPRMFTHGFTTRKEGHGFGLHSSAAAAKDMGGVLSVQSQGANLGATFTLELPLQSVSRKSES